jgi:hypothetical protein
MLHLAQLGSPKMHLPLCVKWLCVPGDLAQIGKIYDRGSSIAVSLTCSFLSLVSRCRNGGTPSAVCLSAIGNCDTQILMNESDAAGCVDVFQQSKYLMLIADNYKELCNE